MKLKGHNDTQNLDAEYFVGIEGGITNNLINGLAFGCMCVVDKDGRVGVLEHRRILNYLRGS